MSRRAMIILILAIYAVLGMFVDSLPLIVLLTPIFLPIINDMQFAEGSMLANPTMRVIWFGVLMVMIMQLGLITPPVGMTVYVMQGIAKNVPLMKIFKGVFPFVIALIIAVIIVAAVPGIALWLPNALYGIAG